jgi:hypothetical protein
MTDTKFDYALCFDEPHRRVMMIHVIPENDSDIHHEDINCPCNPRRDIEEESVIIHNAFDGRDFNTIGTYCLGYTHPKCESCLHLRNWKSLNQMPDSLRLSIQKTSIRINDEKCRLTKMGEYVATPQ